MIYVWIGLAVVLLITGLFIITQGGSQIGGSLALLGIVIGLILAICPTHAQALGGADNCQQSCNANHGHDENHLKHMAIWTLAAPG